MPGSELDRHFCNTLLAAWLSVFLWLSHLEGFVMRALSATRSRTGYLIYKEETKGKTSVSGSLIPRLEVQPVPALMWRRRLESDAFQIYLKDFQ